MSTSRKIAAATVVMAISLVALRLILGRRERGASSRGERFD
jgi:hypothetical protein